jgi:transposase
VTEHQSFTVRCPHCGSRTSGDFPENVNSPVQYGDRIRSYLAYLVHFQLIPYERVTELCSDLFGFSISQGTIVNLTHNLAEKLQLFEERILNRLKSEPLIHCDETGVRVEGKTNWLHVTCTPDRTYYSLQRKRGSEAFDNIGILPEYGGITVHDFWNSYLSYSCKHSFCCAHLIRELTRVEEETSQKWSSELIQLLLEAKSAKEMYHECGVLIPKIIVNSIKSHIRQIS